MNFFLVDHTHKKLIEKIYSTHSVLKRPLLKRSNLIYVLRLVLRKTKGFFCPENKFY